MEKTNQKILEEIIRVDHAGERGAIKIYEGQLLALKTFKKDDELKRKIEDMREHEKEHFEFFDKEIQKRNINTPGDLNIVVNSTLRSAEKNILILIYLQVVSTSERVSNNWILPVRQCHLR